MSFRIIGNTMIGVQYVLGKPDIITCISVNIETVIPPTVEILGFQFTPCIVSTGILWRYGTNIHGRPIDAKAQVNILMTVLISNMP